MTVLSRSFFDLSRRQIGRSIFTRRRSSKTLPIDERKIQKVEEKSTEGSTKQEKDENAQRGDKSSVRVCIIGGGVTPLYTAVLLKQYRIIKSIHLVDTADSTSETLINASHLETSPRINYFQKKDIKQALREVRALGSVIAQQTFI